MHPLYRLSLPLLGTPLVGTLARREKTHLVNHDGEVR